MPNLVHGMAGVDREWKDVGIDNTIPRERIAPNYYVLTLIPVFTILYIVYLVHCLREYQTQSQGPFPLCWLLWEGIKGLLVMQNKGHHLTHKMISGAGRCLALADTAFHCYKTYNGDEDGFYCFTLVIASAGGTAIACINIGI